VLVVLVALLFLLAAVFIVRIVGLIVARYRFCRYGFLFARFLVILPGIEDQMQPRHDLLDRRQLAGRTGFAAWSAFATGAGFALRALFAA
jgi:hypothetical protein